MYNILKAGFRAPIASNQYDSIHITIVQNTEMLKEIASAASDIVYQMLNIRKNMDFGAKTLIIVSGTPAKMSGIEYANAACVLENMVIAATAQKVDSILWGGAAVAVKQNMSLKKLLNIPIGFEPLLCASFGYATDIEMPKEHTIAWNKV